MNEKEIYIEEKVNELNENVADSIKSKYETKYGPEIDKIIKEKMTKILNYFEYGNNLNISNVDEYLKEAQNDIETYTKKLLEERQTETTYETSSIIKNAYDPREEVEENNTNTKGEIAVNIEDKQSYIQKIEIKIENKIVELKARISNELYRKGYSEIQIDNLLETIDSNKLRIINYFIDDITRVTKKFDRELIEEIEEKCDKFIEKCGKESEISKNSEKNEFLESIKPVNIEEIRRKQAIFGQKAASQEKQTQEPEKGYDLSKDNIFSENTRLEKEDDLSIDDIF